jgi:hypothetical protein
LKIFGQELDGQSNLKTSIGQVLRSYQVKGGETWREMANGIKVNLKIGLEEFASGVQNLSAKTMRAASEARKAVEEAASGESVSAAAVKQRAEEAEAAAAVKEIAYLLRDAVAAYFTGVNRKLLAKLITTYLLSLKPQSSEDGGDGGDGADSVSSLSSRSSLFSSSSSSSSSSLGGSKKSRKRINRALLKRNKSKLSLKKANKGMSKRNKGKLSLKRSNKGMSKRNKNKKRTNKRVLTHKKKKHIGGLYRWDEEGDNRPKGFLVLGNKNEFTDITFSDKTYLMKTARKTYLVGTSEYKKNFKLGTLEVLGKKYLIAESTTSGMVSIYDKEVTDSNLPEDSNLTDIVGFLNGIIIEPQLTEQDIRNLNNSVLESTYVPKDLNDFPQYPVPVPVILKDFVETMGDEQIYWKKTLGVRSKKFNVASESFNVTLKSQSKKMYLIMKDTGGELYIKNVTDADPLGIVSIFDERIIDRNKEKKEPRERKNLQEFMSQIALISSNGSTLAHNMFDKSIIAKERRVNCDEDEGRCRRWDLDTFLNNNKSESQVRYTGHTRGGLV